MHVIREPFQITSASYAMDRDAVRAVGCHLSDVIRYMSSKRYADRTDEAREAGFLGGFLLERVLADHAIETEMSGNRAGLVKLGQLIWCRECDDVWVDVEHFTARGHRGIVCTPDPVNLKEWRLEEWKCTKATLRKAGGDDQLNGLLNEIERERPEYEYIGTEFWEWVVQVKSYCYVIGRLYDRVMTRAVVRALFVNGDYGLSTRDYSTQRYWFKFTERELIENWDSVVMHAEDAELLRTLNTDIEQVKGK